MKSLLLLLALLPAIALAAPRSHLVIGTGTITGVYYPAGGALCRLINQNPALPECAVLSTAGSRENLSLLQAGKIDLALVQADLLWEAHLGVGSIRGISPLFTLYTEPLNLVVRADSGIASLEDLKGKRLDLGPAGSGDRTTATALLEAMGWSPDALPQESPVDRAQALCAGEIDALFLVAANPSQIITDLLGRCQARLIPIEGEAVETLLANRPDYRKSHITAGLYPGQEQDLASMGTAAVLVARDDLPASLVYRLDAHLLADMARFQRLHPAFLSLQKEQMLSAVLPLHPGSQAYLEGAPPPAEAASAPELPAGDGDTAPGTAPGEAQTDQTP
ncbi:TAXI family TRAP transporter solute-binding subunit [Aeromonas schubertii]|uniref:TAXI family TRAP transporter solute-binding subunit n=1 Tax=Aeromonas schubertii TaxID=652 RepID=A0ABS7V9Q4_9GAMM|nr:TAXI family TRAP transporter solute-binding subunit [Aeromonas schubertii]MBZ6066107.1 TAXI family TRAP transporter solute-binding subunit [Aeromonas schubertii]